MVNAHHKEVADVYIEDGVILSVRPNIKVSGNLKTMLHFNLSSDTIISVAVTKE